MLISPWIPEGTILRPPEGGNPFDHTSIISTLNALFGPFKSLTKRDKAAPDLRGCLTLPAPSNQGPRSIPLPAPFAASPQIDQAQEKLATEAQNALAAMADALPAGTATVPEHQAKLSKGIIAYASSQVERTAAEALAIAKAGLGRFLHGSSAA